MAAVIALIAGNGLTIDLAREHDLWHPSEPLDFEFDMPGGLPWREALPEMAAMIPCDAQDSFAALQALPLQGNYRLDAEVRHFLALAYSHFDHQVQLEMLQRWRWRRWLRQHHRNLHSIVSFNYETSIERALQSVVGRTIWNACVRNSPTSGYPLLFKPHGSVDIVMAPGYIGGWEPAYPLNNICALNNTPIVQCSRADTLQARIEAFTVLPGEMSPYRDFQWVAPLYNYWQTLAASVTHCVVAGISYWECDRPELNSLLSALPKRANVIIANPEPSEDLLAFVNGTGCRYSVWENGPQRIWA